MKLKKQKERITHRQRQGRRIVTASPMKVASTLSCNLLHLLASTARPVEEAKIAAGACYQKTPLKVLHKRAKEPKLYHTGIVCYYYYYYYHNGTQWVS